MMAAGHQYETELKPNGAQHGDAATFPLHCAAFEGRHLDVQALLRTRREEGGDDGVRAFIEQRDRTGDTALLSALQPAENVSRDANLRCVTALVMAGADTSYTHQRWHSNAVHYAAGATQEQADPAIVGLLLAAHERAGRSCSDLLDARNIEGQTPHDRARAKGNIRTAELLASIRRSPHEALGPFLGQLERELATAPSWRLYETELKPNGAQHGDAATFPLHCAAFEGRHLDVQALLRTRREEGGDDGVRAFIEQRDRTGDTALLSALQPAENVSRDANLRCVTALVMAGADTSYTHQRWHSNAVHYAAGATQEQADPAIVGLLLAAHERAGRSCSDLLDARNIEGQTPHDRARAKGNIRTAELLASIRRSPHEALGPFLGQLEIEEGEDEPEPEPEGEPPRTFATSNFKREYVRAGVVPIRHAHQVMAHLDTFLYTFVHSYGITEEADGRLDPFLASLQGQVQAHADGPSNQLLTEVGDSAELLWTSAETFAGMGEFNQQLCSLLNRAIRDDHPDLAASTAAMARSLNALCVVAPRGGAAAPEFPSGGITWRGTGFDDSLRDFFTEGKEYRVPGFLATSFSQLKAREFIYNEATAYGKPGVLWKVHVDPAGAQDPSRRCKNVNFVRHSLVAGEQEYLFAAYSVFTIRKVTWSEDPMSAPHLIELDAALDNALCSEDLPLAPWY